MGIVREGIVIINTSLNRMLRVYAFLYLHMKTKDDKIPESFSCHRLESNKVKWHDLKNSYIMSKNRNSPFQNGCLWHFITMTEI